MQRWFWMLVLTSATARAEDGPDKRVKSAADFVHTEAWVGAMWFASTARYDLERGSARRTVWRRRGRWFRCAGGMTVALPLAPLRTRTAPEEERAFETLTLTSSINAGVCTVNGRQRRW